MEMCDQKPPCLLKLAGCPPWNMDAPNAWILSQYRVMDGPEQPCPSLRQHSQAVLYLRAQTVLDCEGSLTSHPGAAAEKAGLARSAEAADAIVPEHDC